MPLAVYMHDKFAVYSFKDSQDMEGSQKLKSRSRDPITIPFDLILHLFYKVPCSQSVCEIWRRYLHQWSIYGCFTTSLIWLRNAYSRPFWGGFWVFDPLIVVGYCRVPQKAHPWPETRVLAYRSRWRKQQRKKERKETQRCDKSHICPVHPRFATPTKVVM